MRNQHNYNTRGSKERVIFKITRKATRYGLNSIHHSEWLEWGIKKY